MVCFVAYEMFGEFANSFAYFFYVLLNLKGPQPLHYSHQISEKGCGRYDNHPFLTRRVFHKAYRAGFDGANFVYKKVIINRFRWYKHEGKLQCSFVRTD